MDHIDKYLIKEVTARMRRDKLRKVCFIGIKPKVEGKSVLTIKGISQTRRQVYRYNERLKAWNRKEKNKWLKNTQKAQ